MRTRQRISGKAAVFTTVGLILFVFSLMNRHVLRLMRGDEPHLLCRDSAEWQTVALPDVPYEIQAGSAGDIWAATCAGGGLSRWSGGQWTRFGDAHVPFNGFAVSGKQAWVAEKTGVERFDGRQWHSLPVAIQDPMASTAEGDQVWIVNGSGMLAHCVAEVCETTSVVKQIPDGAWQSGILGQFPRRGSQLYRLGYRTLVRAHGRLRFIHNSVWYSSDGRQWI